MLKTLNEYEELTLKWSADRGITINGKAETQTLKLISEAGELCDNIAKGKDIKDDIGDMLVVLTNIAKLKGTTLAECWEVAYNDIKDRKGFLNANGTFIKSTDDNYEELLAEFEGTKVEDPKCVDIEGHLDGEFAEVKFSDGTKEKIRFSGRFILEYPDPFVLTKSFMIENNEVLSEN